MKFTICLLKNYIDIAYQKLKVDCMNDTHPPLQM